jgi:hypothetical protein
VTNYNYALYKSLQHYLRPLWIKRSFYLYVGLQRRSSIKRNLRPFPGDDFSRSCFFTQDLRRNEAWAQHWGFPKLLQPPSDSVSHGCSVAESGCLLQAGAHSALLGHWGLTAAGLPSLDIASPNDLALHYGNMLCFHPELVLLDCSG